MTVMERRRWALALHLFTKQGVSLLQMVEELSALGLYLLGLIILKIRYFEKLTPNAIATIVAFNIVCTHIGTRDIVQDEIKPEAEVYDLCQFFKEIVNFVKEEHKEEINKILKNNSFTLAKRNFHTRASSQHERTTFLFDIWSKGEK
ncbi:hypothetical protein ACJX0J_007744 [Zea mays]